jgi:hypothetical protein
MIAMLAALAVAQASGEHCMQPVPVAGFRAWWSRPATSSIRVGIKAVLALKPAAKVRFEPALARPPKSDAFGGVFPFDVTSAGRYRVALSTDAWVDMVRRGERLKSVDHAHGPDCSGIAKIVAFDLQPGRYGLQLSEAKEATIGVMVSQAPK